MHKKNYRHPASLRIFFATEMWERYGFYVVQTLLALYLALQFSWPDKQVYALVGSFTALTYLSPVVGGWIADQLLGQKRAILIGAVVLFLSYLALSFTNTTHGLSLALAGVAVGTGLLKPNISSLLGNEYPIGSPHRESGFTIFYMGITSGIILGTTIPSFLNQHFGWSISFLSASIGMIFSFFIFSYGIYKYRITDYSTYNYQRKSVVFATILIALLWVGSFYILTFPFLADAVFLSVVMLALGYLFYCIKNESKQQARQTMIIVLLCIISVMFWAFYFQMFMSLTLFIARVAKPTLWGISFPPPYYVAIQSAGMIVIGLILANRKTHVNSKERSLSTGNKFLMAMICMTLAYLVITVVAKQTLFPGLISPLFILPAYLMISLAELLLSPVGLAAITELASRKKVSTMMGIFFVSLGIGGFLSGKLASLTAVQLIGSSSIPLLKAHYAEAFSHILYILCGATIICLLLNYVIRTLVPRSPNKKPIN